jgi:NADH-quinone oxidoreductase subunit N
LIGMFNVVVSLYYYALIVKAAYFLKPDEDLPRISLSPAIQLLTLTLIVSSSKITPFTYFVIPVKYYEV